MLNKMYFKAKNTVLRILKDERGDTSIIAIILILAIVIALAIIFRGAIKGLFDQIMGGITSDVADATTNY